MKQKEWSHSGGSKLKPLISIFWEATGVVCWRCFLKKSFLNSICILKNVCIRENDLSKVTATTLLESVSLMDNFLEVFQGFNKNSCLEKRFFNLTNVDR